MKKAFLILETGEAFEGVWRGGQPRAGEVVFNTSHSGYEEIATDPSYFKQMIVMTAPMQGNYGVSKSFWESKQFWIEGFMALEIQQSERDHSWLSRLDEMKIPTVSDLDTRKIVLRLREGGTPWGALLAADSKEDALAKGQKLIAEARGLDKDWVWLVSRRTTEVRRGERAQGPRIAVLDFGSKENILRELDRRCSEIHVFPSRTKAEDIMAIKPDGLFLTNGPGDPGDVQQAPDTVRALLGKIPIMGICMGHQILAIALGAKTYKLKFGHRGANHPIRDQLLNIVYMSSQNHGYAVQQETLPKNVTVTHINLNDQTVAGIFSPTLNCLGVQYHPESHPGPHEASKLFDYFVDKMVTPEGKK